MRSEKTYSKKAYFITHSTVLALLLILCTIANILTAKWDSVLTEFFGSVGGTQAVAQAGDFISEYPDDAALLAAQLDHTRRVVAEGVVLLRNENSFLPLKEGSKLSVFGLSSVSGVTTGSGSGDIEIKSDTLAGALQKAGFSINSELNSFTSSSGQIGRASCRERV